MRLPGNGNSNSHGARPVQLIITMIKLIPHTFLVSTKSKVFVQSSLLTARPNRFTRALPSRGSRDTRHLFFDTPRSIFFIALTPPTFDVQLEAGRQRANRAVLLTHGQAPKWSKLRMHFEPLPRDSLSDQKAAP